MTYSDSSRAYADIRYNFDYPDAVGFFAGQIIDLTKGGGIQFVPQLGAIVGGSGENQYVGISPEAYVWGGFGRFKFVTLNQASVGVTDRSDGFLYHWSEFRAVIIRDRLRLG